MVDETDTAWAEWREHIFGDPYTVWHDGPEFSRLYAAHQDDAELVDRMLLAGVAAHDSLAAESIGRLEPKRAVPEALESMAATQVAPSGDFALRRAEALFALTGDVAHRRSMIAILNGGGHWGLCIDAARAVGRLEPTYEAIDALEKAAADDDYLVRYHAANALLKCAGQEPVIEKHRFFATIATPTTGDRVTAAHRKGWADTADQLASDARTALRER